MKSVFVVQIYSTLTNKIYYNLIKNANIFPGWNYTPECTRLSQRTCNLQNFPGGACPRTPLDYFGRLLYFIHRLQLCLKWRTLRDPLNTFRLRVLTSSGSTGGGRGGGGGAAKTIISPNTSFGDIMIFQLHVLVHLKYCIISVQTPVILSWLGCIIY